MMTRIVSFLLLGWTVAFASCEDKKTDAENQWFLTPTAVVSGTTVEMSCQTRFGEGVLDGTTVGFSYASVINGQIQGFVESTNSRVEGRGFSSTLSGLASETMYVVYAYADLSTGRVKSSGISFRTGTGENPDPDPDPDPEQPTFGTPATSAVTQTSATLSCQITFADQSANTVYFLYKPASSFESGYSRENVSAGSGLKTVTLTGLAPATAYEFKLCADWDGATYNSAVETFTTQQASANPGATKYAGWPELLSEEELPDDYYYAYHYSAGKPGGRNFSVCYSKKLRGAVWVAYPMHKSYTDGSAGRNDSWKYDPIVPSFVQPNLSSSYKASGDGSFSRGHMLASNDRQSDVATNKQTFYYTNMSPQIQNGFNGGIWATLEKNCHTMICSDTLYMVTGAHFANENKHCEDKDGNRVTVPTHYYKVLIRSKSGNTGKPVWTLPADQIECAGYWFEHKVYSGSQPSQFIKSVSWIEQQTGQTFFPNVPNAPKEKLTNSFWRI